MVLADNFNRLGWRVLVPLRWVEDHDTSDSSSLGFEINRTVARIHKNTVHDAVVSIWISQSCQTEILDNEWVGCWNYLDVIGSPFLCSLDLLAML